MAVEPQVQQFIDFIRDEMPRRIKTNPNNLPDAQKLLVSVSGTLEVIYKTLAELDIAIKSDVDTALSSKEPTITAGTSAQYYRGDKTFQPLNTNAVTESTDKRYLSDAQKTIATQAATSTLSGYLSSTDWSTFNGKQAALVSGTNIKTVNGSSLLGNGDLVVSATEVNDNVFRIVDSDNISRKIAFDAVNVANSTTVTLTVPNKNINLGDLPSIATTNGNNITAAARLLRGANCTLGDNSPCVLNGLSIGSAFTTGGAGIVRGGAGDSSYLRPAYVNIPLARYSIGTTSGIWAINATGAGGGITHPMGVAPFTNGGSMFVATHRLTFSIVIISITGANYVWTGVRRIVCTRDQTSFAISIASITTEGTDYVQSGITGQALTIVLGTTVDPELATSYAPLQITATSTTPNATGILCQASLESYYSNLG